MDFIDSPLLLIYKMFYDLLLSSDHRGKLCVNNLWIELAVHQRGPFVLLDVTLIDWTL